jgi:putative ABC transport system permease protein
VRTLYRFALLACPVSIRRAYGQDMADLFEVCVAAASTGRPWPMRTVAVLRGLADALAFALSTRLDSSTEGWAVGDQEIRPRRPVMKKQDVLTTLRFIRAQPLFAGAIVLMLALGIGATTALFSVVYGVLLRPLPFPEPDRIVEVLGRRLDQGWYQVSLTEANFWDLADLNHTLEAFGAWHGASAILTDGAEPEQVNAALVSSGFFRALGVQPVAGRLFGPDDDVNGGTTRPVMLSHRLWIRRYAGDWGIVGRPIMLSSGPRTVVGVLPAGTPWLDSGEIFFPLVRRADADRGSFEYAGVARLKPGVSQPAALADLQVVSKSLERRYPDTNAGLSVTLQSSHRWIASDDVRRMLWILLGAVWLLLVIACVNVTNLLLARAASRARETAVRAALGATRGDLVREWLVESLLLSTTATGVGLALAVGVLRVMQAVSPGDLPRLDEVTVNGWAFGVAGGLAILVGVATGLVPALQAPQGDVLPALRHGQRGAVGDRRQNRLRHVFVGAEVALSLILLVGAGLLVRSLAQVLTVDRGFQTDHRLLATVTIPTSYGEARMSRVNIDLFTRIRAMPEVISVAAVSGRPLSRGSTGLGVLAGDQPDAPGAAVPWATWRIITPDYFRTMGVPLLAGRGFTDDEVIGKPWRAIVSQRTADLLWPGRNPIGRTIILWKGQGDNRAEVIGIVGNMRERGLEADPTLAVYLPAGHQARGAVHLVMRTRANPEDVVPALRAAVTSVDPHLPVSNPQSLDGAVTASVATRRFTMLVLAAFAGLALVLALAGVAGVLAYTTARRTQEIGLRLALGAEPRQLLRLVVARGMLPVFAGIAVGLAVTLWLSQLMSTLLFGITSSDPATYAFAASGVAVATLIACYLPARRVLVVDPAVSLRAE